MKRLKKMGKNEIKKKIKYTEENGTTRLI